MIRLCAILSLLVTICSTCGEEDVYGIEHSDAFQPMQEQPHVEQPHSEKPQAPSGAEHSAEAPAGWTTAPSEPPPTTTPFRGNWFKKRTLLQEMRVSQEALHKMVQEVWIPDHKKFQELYGPVVDQMRTELDKIGFSEQTVSDIEQQVMALSTTSTVLNQTTQVPSQLMPTATFETNSALNLLKEMKESLQLLNEIKENVVKAVQQIQQQEPLGANFDQQAWKYYEEIDAAYDDLQAAQLYDQIRSSEEYLKNLHQYMLRDISPYINHLLGRFDALLKHVGSVYNALIQQGVILRKEDIPAPKPPAPAPVIPQPTWWQRIWAWITVPFYAIVHWIGSWFGSGKK